MIKYVVDVRRAALNNVFPSAEEAIEQAGQAARRHPEEYPNGCSVWEVDPDRDQGGPGEPHPGLKVHFCRVMRDGTVHKSKGKSPYGELAEGRDDGATGPDGSTEQDETVEQALAGANLTAGRLDRLSREIDAIVGTLQRRGAGARVLAGVHGLADRVAGAKNARLEQAAARVQDGQVVAGRFKVVARQAATLFVEDTVTGKKYETDVLGLAGLVLAEGPATADHVPAGSVAVVDDQKTVFVLFCEQGPNPVYRVLDERNVLQDIPDTPDRIRPAVDTGDPEATKVRRVWGAFFASLLRQLAVKSADDLDPEQKRVMIREAQAKWPVVKNKMLDGSQQESPEQSQEQEQEPDQSKPAERPGQKAVKPAEKPAKPEPKSEPEKPAKNGKEPAESMAGFMLELCGQNVEAASRLARAFAYARQRDQTRYHAMASMQRYCGYQLPDGWMDRAASLMDRDAARVKAAKTNGTLVPPADVRAVSNRAIRAMLANPAGISRATAEHAKALASGRAVGVDDLVMMRAVLARGSGSMDAVQWDAWGGHPGVRWLEQVRQDIGV
jgi:hypothetical protein